MSGMTKREEVWTYVLTMTHRKKTSVHPNDVANKIGVTEKTAREAIHAMETNGFVTRRMKGRESHYVAPTGGI